MSKTADETSSAPATTPESLPVKTSPSRRSALDYYFNPSRASDRFWRMFTSREKTIENLKTLVFWVIPITLVVWIYAEREQVVIPNGPNVSNVSVEIVSGDSRRWVEMVGTQHTVNLKLTGPQQAVEHVRSLLTTVTAGRQLGLVINVPASMANGNNQPINIAALIQDNSIFRSNGVSVESAEPANFYVNIDRLGQRELPVKIPPGITNLTAETHFTPPTVAVTGPETLLAQISPPNGDLQAYANLVGNDSLKSEGQHSISSVQVTPSSHQDKLRVIPVEVQATITVRKADQRYTIENLPITVNVAPSTMENFRLLLPNGESTTFTVIGPQDQIDAIKEGRFIVKASLDIVPADSSVTAPPSKKLTYILPPGVKVDPDTDHPVEFKLTHRE